MLFLLCDQQVLMILFIKILQLLKCCYPMFASTHVINDVSIARERESINTMTNISSIPFLTFLLGCVSSSTEIWHCTCYIYQMTPKRKVISRSYEKYILLPIYFHVFIYFHQMISLNKQTKTNKSKKYTNDSKWRRCKQRQSADYELHLHLKSFCCYTLRPLSLCIFHLLVLDSIISKGIADWLGII